MFFVAVLFSSAHWLPDAEEYHCRYIALWLAIKEKYQLDIDKAEQLAIDDLTTMCEY